jgi:MYXO-CTERM domain-containing protein
LEKAVAFTGAIPADGFYLAGASTDLPNFVGESVDFDLPGANDQFENSDTLTFLLVTGYDTGVAVGTDLDTNDDGTLETTPYTGLVDSVAVLDDASELPYSTTQIGPNGTFPPSAIYRSPDGSGAFTFDPAAQTSFASDTPGVANVPEPTGLALLGLGGILAVRRGRRAAV